VCVHFLLHVKTIPFDFMSVVVAFLFSSLLFFRVRLTCSNERHAFETRRTLDDISDEQRSGARADAIERTNDID
jgi:hypothetical protein